MAHVVPVSSCVQFAVLKNDSEPAVHQRLTGETKTCELNQKQLSPDRWISLCTAESMLILESERRRHVEIKYVDYM